jgi:hypothetical protein
MDMAINESMALHMARQTLGWGEEATAQARAVIGALVPVARMSGAPYYSPDAVCRAVQFAAGKASQARHEERVREASARLKAIPGIGSGRLGLTPDSVKASAEYRAARAAYEEAHATAARFNERFLAKFKRELREERRARGR